MKTEITCDNCGLVFESDWSEEEALAEKERLFGDFPLEDCAHVCDECFKAIMAQLN
jgi:rubredoxin